MNVSSAAGVVGSRAGAAYTVSKHGLIGVTRSIATAYGREGIRCVAVCRGRVDTLLGLGVRGHVDPRGQAVLERTRGALVRTQTPERIDEIVLFAASEAARGINGDVMVADVGRTSH